MHVGLADEHVAACGTAGQDVVGRVQGAGCRLELRSFAGGNREPIVELVSTLEDMRQYQGLWSYSDVEKRTRGEESLKAAAVEASKLAVVAEKRIVCEVATEEVALVRVASPVALRCLDNSREPR